MKASKILKRRELALVKDLQVRALRFFIENQLENGLILDRQRNHEDPVFRGLISTSATGMGLVAIALASTPEYGLISRTEARKRVRKAIQTTLNDVIHLNGMMPHFIDTETGPVGGDDFYSTVDGMWLIAGALLAAELLDDRTARTLANKLHNRVEWKPWLVTDNASGALRLSMGAHKDGTLLPALWERLNAETVFMYLMGIGARKSKAIPASVWYGLDFKAQYCQGLQLPSGDLGLFASQYSQSWLGHLRLPRVDLEEVARLSAMANKGFCEANAAKYSTFTKFWGLTAGDGPGKPGEPDVYRAYAPCNNDVDGTAHVTGTLGSIAVAPDLVRSNLTSLLNSRQYIGRYGASNVNLDRNWQSRDIIGIDLGAAVFGIDDLLHSNRIAKAFRKVGVVKNAIRRIEKFNAIA